MMEISKPELFYMEYTQSQHMIAWICHHSYPVLTCDYKLHQHYQESAIMLYQLHCFLSKQCIVPVIIIISVCQQIKLMWHMTMNYQYCQILDREHYCLHCTYGFDRKLHLINVIRYINCIVSFKVVKVPASPQKGLHSRLCIQVMCNRKTVTVIRF